MEGYGSMDERSTYMSQRLLKLLGMLLALTMIAAACGSDDADTATGDDDAMGEDGDVVSPREGAQLQRLRKGFRLSSMCWEERP